MPDKNEVERRKQIERELKLKAKQEFEAGLPMRREEFKAMFDYLDNHLAETDCDNTLNISIEFLEAQKLDNIDEIIEWLINNGGNCDCEVLANVEEKFDDNAIL